MDEGEGPLGLLEAMEATISNIFRLCSSHQHSGGEACKLNGLPVLRKKAYLSGESMSMQLFLKDNIEL